MKTTVMQAAVLLAAGCAGPQAAPAEAPLPPPAYTTSSGSGTAQHTMPDGTTMSGHQHGEHAGGQHGPSDGGTTQDHAHDHAPGATHVMPDGAVMRGAHHGEHP